MEKETRRSDPSLQPLQPVELAALRAAGTVLECEPDSILFERGEAGDSMYVLEKGRVELAFGDGTEGKVLGSGELFGELVFILGNHPRSATARVMTRSRLRKIDGEAVEELFELEPRLMVDLFRRTCRYLLSSEERLIGSLRRKNQELARTLDYLRRTQEEVDYHELKANTDDLTGLYNRRCFDAQLGKFLERAESSAGTLALVFVDLDNFKAVNDTYGHAAGDQVLRNVGEILKGASRSSDLPCRFGGDEFALILADIDSATGERRAEDVRQRINAAPPVAAAAVRVTASIGGTLLRHGETASELFERSDRLLYQAKDEGRNRVIWSVEAHSGETHSGETHSGETHSGETQSTGTEP